MDSERESLDEYDRLKVSDSDYVGVGGSENVSVGTVSDSEGEVVTEELLEAEALAENEKDPEPESDNDSETD